MESLYTWIIARARWIIAATLLVTVFLGWGRAGSRSTARSRLDSAENILADKLTALVDREEPKDLADVSGFCCTLGLSLENALVGAQSKAAGLFAPDVARVLLQASADDWGLVRWISAPDQERFVSDLHALGERLVLLAGDG
jgi:hypothetical protein